MSVPPADASRPEEEDEEEDEDYVPEDDQPQTAEEKEVIARRTRAQHSLKETAWEELERWLNEQQPSPSPPGTPAESRSLYADFLARLRDPGPALDDGAETDPGEDDFDFVPQEDAEKKLYGHHRCLALCSRDDDMRSGGEYIPKAELAALFGTEPNKRKKRPRHQKQPPAPRPPPKLIAPKPLSMSVLPTLAHSALSESQVELVRSQIATHVQLLIQTYLMSRSSPETHIIADQQYLMLHSLVHYRSLSDQISSRISAVAASNVRTTRRAVIRSRPSVLSTPLLGVVSSLPPPPHLETAGLPAAPPAAPAAAALPAAQPTQPATPAATVELKTPAAALPEQTPFVFEQGVMFPELERFDQLLNPALKVKIDDKRRRKPKHVGTKREAFKKEDDEALLLGLKKYGRTWSAIQSEFLPNWPIDKIINRFRNLTATRASLSAIKEWASEGAKPLSQEEVATLLSLVDIHGPQWEKISRAAFVSRTPAFLRKVYAQMVIDGVAAGHHVPPRPLDPSILPLPLPLPLTPALPPVVPLPLSTVLAEPVKAEEFEVEELASDSDDEAKGRRSKAQRVTPTAAQVLPTPLPAPHNNAHDGVVKAEEFEVEELHSDEESPSKPADNILLVNGRTVYFTREQDREILLAVATTADSATQGARLRELATSGKLGNKTEAEIAQRYQQLLELQQRARRKS